MASVFRVVLDIVNASGESSRLTFHESFPSAVYAVMRCVRRVRKLPGYRVVTVGVWTDSREPFALVPSTDAIHEFIKAGGYEVLTDPPAGYRILNQRRDYTYSREQNGE